MSTFDSPLVAELLAVGCHLGQTVEEDWGPCHSLRWEQEEARQTSQELGSSHLGLVAAEMAGLGMVVVEEVVEGRVQNTGPPWVHGDHEGGSGGEVVAAAVGDPNPGLGTVLFDALILGSEERPEEVG